MSGHQGFLLSWWLFLDNFCIKKEEKQPDPLVLQAGVPWHQEGEYQEVRRLFTCSFQLFLSGQHLVASSPSADQLQCPLSSCGSAGPSGLCGPMWFMEFFDKAGVNLDHLLTFRPSEKLWAIRTLQLGRFFGLLSTVLTYSWFKVLCFRCTTKWFSYTHINIYSHFFFRFSNCIGYYTILSRVLEFLLLYSGSLLIFYFICSVSH